MYHLAWTLFKDEQDCAGKVFQGDRDLGKDLRCKSGNVAES